MKEKERWKEFFAVERNAFEEEKLQKVKRLAAQEVQAGFCRERQSFGLFVLKQFRFLAWKIWFFQGMVLAVMCVLVFQMFGACDPLYTERNFPAFLCGCSGAAALSAFPFLSRAARCRMFETEQATWFSGAGRIGAQLLFLGIGDVCMLLVLAMLAVRFQLSGSLLFVSVVIPFLTAETGVLMLWLHSGAEAFRRAGILIGLLPTGAVMWLVRRHGAWLDEQTLGLWAMTGLVCIVLSGIQCRKLLVQNDLEKLLETEV